jgi:hypothetical protein
MGRRSIATSVHFCSRRNRACPARRAAPLKSLPGARSAIQLLANLDRLVNEDGAITAGALGEWNVIEHPEGSSYQLIPGLHADLVRFQTECAGHERGR